MKQFIKNVFASALGFLLMGVFSFFIMIAVVAALSGGDKVMEITDNSILKLDLSGPIFDRVDESPFDAFANFDLEKKGSLELMTILDNIEKAKKDDKIKGIAITSGLVFTGSAHISAIRDKLLEFKESGKFIYSYSDVYTQKGYWLSSVADSIFMNPVGKLEFKGLAAQITFFKKFQEKYGVKYDVIRHGKYKSAVEPFLEEKMSVANREQTSKLINAIWNTYLEDIASSRNISIKELNRIADYRLADMPVGAVSTKLIDKLYYKDEFFDLINKSLDKEAGTEIDFVSLNDYEKVKPLEEKEYSKNKIAVIYAEGEIVYMGKKTSSNVVNPKKIVEAIRDIKNNDRVKGVVLRVNSPGGSALSSDIIWRELELLKNKKPYAVSFGNVAASGGYYIACGADKIFAQKNTITGSIGVFGMLPNLEKAATKMGITTDVVTTNKHSFEFSLVKGASPKIKQLILKEVESIYKSFVNKVATGRKMNFEQVDKIGQGRVWSAKDALKIGLVDQIGSLQDAIDYIANKTELEVYRTVFFPKKEDAFEKIMKSLGTEVETSLLKYGLGEDAFKVYSDYKSFSQRKGIQMSLPYDISIN